MPNGIGIQDGKGLLAKAMKDAIQAKAKKAKKFTSRAGMKIDGLPVVDAKKSVVLYIGQHDVPRSKSKNPAACVAAQACVRDLGAEEARVHLSRIFIKLPKARKWLRFNTPGVLRAEIISFDRGGRFTTGAYHLYPPNPSATRAAQKARNDKRARHDLGKKGVRKMRKPQYITGVRVNAHQEYGHR